MGFEGQPLINTVFEHWQQRNTHTFWLDPKMCTNAGEGTPQSKSPCRSVVLKSLCILWVLGSWFSDLGFGLKFLRRDVSRLRCTVLLLAARCYNFLGTSQSQRHASNPFQNPCNSPYQCVPQLNCQSAASFVAPKA